MFCSHSPSALRFRRTHSTAALFSCFEKIWFRFHFFEIYSSLFLSQARNHHQTFRMFRSLFCTWLLNGNHCRKVLLFTLTSRRGSLSLPSLLFPPLTRPYGHYLAVQWHLAKFSALPPCFGYRKLCHLAPLNWMKVQHWPSSRRKNPCVLYPYSDQAQVLAVPSSSSARGIFSVTRDVKLPSVQSLQCRGERTCRSQTDHVCQITFINDKKRDKPHCFFPNFLIHSLS